MADITLQNGREIAFDLSAMTLREYRGLFDPKQPQSQEDEIAARVSGLTVDEYLDLPQPDWRRLMTALLKKAREPLSDPS
jgi:hypothetical protein